MNEAAPISSSPQEQANMFLMIFDDTVLLLPLLVKLLSQGATYVAAQKQVSINMMHIEMLSNAVQPNTAAGNWPRWSLAPYSVMVVPRFLFFWFFFH